MCKPDEEKPSLTIILRLGCHPSNLKRTISGILYLTAKDFDKLQDFMDLVEEIYKRASEIPNRTHESVVCIQAFQGGTWKLNSFVIFCSWVQPTGDAAGECVLKTGNKIEQKTPTIDKISELYGWLKEEHISLYSTQRAYILRNELADLEQALVQYTLKYLKDKVTEKTV